MRIFGRGALLAALFIVPILKGLSQVQPAGIPPPHGFVFADFSGQVLNSNTGQYGNYVYGTTLGGFIQFRPFIGLEVRGGVLKGGSQLHRNTGLVGPRVAFSHNRFRYDGVFLFGLSHGGYILQPIVVGSNGRDLIGYGPNTALEIAGGVDYRLTRRVYWEMGDVGYNHIFVQNGQGGVTFSSGLMVRLF
jgi:hypothetical protein